MLEGWTLFNLGTLYSQLLQYSKAIEYYQQALPIFQKLGDRKGEASTLQSLGDTYNNLLQYGKAIKYYQQVIDVSRQDSNGYQEGLALIALARLTKDIKTSESLLLRAITAWESESLRFDTVFGPVPEGVDPLERFASLDEENIELLEDRIHISGALQKVLIAQSKAIQAPEIAERGRTKAFVKLLVERLSIQELGARSQIGATPLDIQQIRQIG